MPSCQDAKMQSAGELVRYNQEVRRQCIAVTELKNYGGPLTLLNTFIAVGTGLEEKQHLHWRTHLGHLDLSEQLSVNMTCFIYYSLGCLRS